MTYSIDPRRSTFRLRTRAGGFLSALAHDLELSGAIARGTATHNGESWEGELGVAPSSIKVVGAIKRGVIDRGVLSAGDIRDIERRVVGDVFAGVGELLVRCSGTVAAPTILVRARSEARARVALAVERDDATRVVLAKGSLSIRDLGLSEVRGPLGAFVIKDEVEFDATATLVPAA